MRSKTSTVVKMGLLALIVPLASACGGNDEERLAAPPDAVMPQSANFAEPHSVPVGNGSLSLIVQPLRLETNSSGSEPQEILIADVGASAEFGQPYLDPEQFHAFASDGQEFQRMENPESFLGNPLQRTDITEPGETVEGSVGFIVPPGSRIGRLDFSTPESTLSYTVVLQPVNPANATEEASDDASAG